MNGNIDFYFIPLAAASSALHSDKLTILAVSSSKRVPVIPNTPTVVEAGYPGAVFRFWNGISAPAKTPPDVVKKLHDVTEEALKMPAVQEKLAKLGVEPAQISTKEFGKFFKEDFDATVDLAKKANIKSVD
jgi:tripartite-type tricarboxylate transporter receptor subunit TctC